MWIFSVGDSGKITKHHKKTDAPPPVIQIGNPPPLLDLVNRHSLAIFLLVWFAFGHICCWYMISTLGECSNWSNQSNDSDHVYFRRLGNDHPSFILDNSLWCTTSRDCFLEDKAITVVMWFIYTYLSLWIISWIGLESICNPVCLTPFLRSNQIDMCCRVLCWYPHFGFKTDNQQKSGKFNVKLLMWLERK